MKPKTSISITAMVLFAALTSPAWLFAQHTRYKLIDLGTFGGPQSYVNFPINYAPVLNDRGTVTGWADTSTTDQSAFCFNEDCYVSHAFKWRAGIRTDLGALVDVDGVSSQSTWISANGLIAGTSQNGETDPLFPGFPENRAVLWRKGHITDLGTLPEGGYESAANAVNSKGQVVGWATNTIPDPYSMIAPGFLPTQTRAFLSQGGVMQDLGTLGTGSDAIALLVNERGQIVGESYINSQTSTYCNNAFGFALTTGAFIWELGEMKNLGSFGGSCTGAADLNNQGVVVGISTSPGDTFQLAFLWDGSLHELPNTIGGHDAAAIAINEAGDVVGWASVSGSLSANNLVTHASLWKKGIMTDLGTLGTDPCSNGFSVNAAEQVVGISVAAGVHSPCNFDQTRAFLWQKGSMVDLNTLIPADSSLYLTSPETINDRGEIAGVGVDISNGNQHAFLLIPCSSEDTACQDVPAGVAFRPAPATTNLANNQNNVIRRMFRHRLGLLPTISSSSTSYEPSAHSASGRLAEKERAAKARDLMPNSLDMLDVDSISQAGTALTCSNYGWPCSPNGYPRCCGTLKCEFHGGSTRVGYMCE